MLTIDWLIHWFWLMIDSEWLLLVDWYWFVIGSGCGIDSDRLCMILSDWFWSGARFQFTQEKRVRKARTRERGNSTHGVILYHNWCTRRYQLAFTDRLTYSLSLSHLCKHLSPTVRARRYSFCNDRGHCRYTLRSVRQSLNIRYKLNVNHHVGMGTCRENIRLSRNLTRIQLKTW